MQDHTKRIPLNASQPSARKNLSKANEIDCKIFLLVPERHNLHRYFGVKAEHTSQNNMRTWEQRAHSYTRNKPRTPYAKIEPQTTADFFDQFDRVYNPKNIYFVCENRMRALMGLGADNIKTEFSDKSGLLYVSDTLLVGWPRIKGRGKDRTLAYPFKRSTDGNFSQASVQWQTLEDHLPMPQKPEQRIRLDLAG
ncbi:MAG: hypothetical protein KDI46_01235 [Alphaproteobacteria bacterium]|nr:hypothetical protein [Alphaproteobacteria bacterium]